MNYQNLTFTQLRGLLTERAVVGRSKATTKEKAIALLEECDRALVQKQLSKFPLSADPAPAVNDADFAPVAESEPKFRDERSLSSAPTGNETPAHGALAINPSLLGSIPAFRLDILQIERLLGQSLSARINRPRGEDVAFVNTPKDLASGVDRAIASYLMRAKFEFIGRLNLTAKYSPLDIEVQTIVSSPIIDTIYGWEIHSCGIVYGKPGSPWKFIFQPGMIFGEMPSPLVADIYEIACSKLSAKLSRQFFGPMPIADVSTLRGNHHTDWLCTSDGYWHCRHTVECVQVFRWWWSHANGGQWKLDYCKVLPDVPKYRCLCGAEACKHLGIIEKFQLKRQQQERQKQFAEIEKQRQIEFAAVSQERRELVQFLREKHFKLASDIGFALFRQPFWGLSLNQLKQIHEEINQVKKP